jgi:exodeoxyribonuclease V alpha subunit
MKDTGTNSAKSGARTPLSGLPLSPHGTARARLDAEAAFASAYAERIAEAPYLGPELAPQDAFLAFEVSGWATALPPADRRRFESLVAALLGEIGRGSTRLPVTKPEAALLGRLPELVGPPEGRTPLIIVESNNRTWLSTHRLYAAEARLAGALKARMSAPGGFDESEVAAAVAAVSARAQPAPSDEQQAAVKAALAGKIGVITGGPGTGKTTVALTLVRTLVRLGVAPEAIALAAPTGKAANRLGEALRAGLARLAPGDAADEALLRIPPEPETLHRLLRHSPSARAFAHREGTPLPHEVVIVDESSMIDLGLMDRLVAALGSKTLLVLLGDADQLPSVEAGAVFRDLAALGVRLVQSHRMDPRRPEGRRILALATAVRAGKTDVTGLVDRRASAAAIAWDGVELCPAAERDAFVARWFDERVMQLPALAALTARPHVFYARAEAGGFEPASIALFDEVFDHHQRHRLLAVTRTRATGVEALNAWLHARFGGRTGFVPGEPVMMLRNDYDRGLWNGDQGLVVEIVERTGEMTRREPRPRLVALFKIDGRWTPFPLDGLRDSLTLAFALTVHKAQGSEYDEVALILPETPHPLLSRDLIYTALTRCRRALILCGDEPVLAAGIANAVARASGLSAALAR